MASKEGLQAPELPSQFQKKLGLKTDAAAGSPASATKGPVLGKAVGLVTRALDVGKDLMQSFKPIEAIHEHNCAFHMYAHDMSRQVEAHHFCSHPSEEVRQCVIYDSNQPGARLIGIEYIISSHLFESLPEEEKRFWHSHKYEVSSGMLVAPGVPNVAERQAMQQLAFTYGKTWHMWQVDRGDPLPIGPPQLMMAATADGQIDPQAWSDRDARLGVDSTKKRRDREALDYPERTDPAANSWQSGHTWQVEMRQMPVKRASFPPLSQEPGAPEA